MIDELFKAPGDFDIKDNKFVVERINCVCQQSKEAFRHFIRVVARRMIKYRFPANMQMFLNQFLAKFKLFCSKDDLFQMYDDELINYLLICDVSRSENDNDEVKQLVMCSLERLRQKNYENFTILCTHFPEFHHLLTKF